MSVTVPSEAAAGSLHPATDATTTPATDATTPATGATSTPATDVPAATIPATTASPATAAPGTVVHIVEEPDPICPNLVPVHTLDGDFLHKWCVVRYDTRVFPGIIQELGEFDVYVKCVLGRIVFSGHKSMTCVGILPTMSSF